MGDGEYDASEQAGHGPLPPDDRIWRHPSEIAAEARVLVAQRRRRRQRAGASLIGGLGAVSGLMWLSTNGATTVAVTSDIVAVDIVAVGSTDAIDGSSTTSTSPPLAALTSHDAPRANDMRANDMIVVRSAESAELLAGALAARDGFVITSGRALNGADHVMVGRGDSLEAGTVVGYDAVTDVSVIELDESASPSAIGSERVSDDASLDDGDFVTIADSSGTNEIQQVVKIASTSALDDGAPVVGIVELDGRLGEISPGSPAYDSDGAIVGMTSSTAASAPAALIPIALVREIADELIDHGRATHPWIGISARNDGAVGSMITSVTDAGPADVGGIQAGDLVIEIGESSIHSMEEMVATLRGFEPGDLLTIVVLRDGQHVTCPVELALQTGVA